CGIGSAPRWGGILHGLRFRSCGRGSCATLVVSLLRIWIAFGQSCRQLCIMTVDVLVEMHLVILVSKRSCINDEDRHLFGEAHSHVVIPLQHTLLHAFERPTGVASESPRGEFGWIFDANTTVAKVAPGS